MKRKRLSKIDRKVMTAFVKLKRRLHGGKFNVALVEKKPWGGYETKSKWFESKEAAERYAKSLAKSVRGDERFYVKLLSADKFAVYTSGKVFK